MQTRAPDPLHGISPDNFQTAAEAFLWRLKAVGIDYIFANGGTDFPPLIEALARGPSAGIDMPEALVIPHETAAVGMAHGYYLMTGQPQAVMVHVNVGLANALMGVINAASDNIPIIVCSGRTPITETGRHGSRNAHIHWGQEMRDQGGMIRESVKWDYELRYGEQATELVDRAVALAMSAPRGPVYMSLPREALAEPWQPPAGAMAPPPVSAAEPAPDMAAVDAAAEILAAAENPLIITQRGTSWAPDFEPLAGFAEKYAVPVVQHTATRPSLGSEHPMNAGTMPDPWLETADVILVLDARVPWIPSRQGPGPAARVIQVGPDPLFAGSPVRGFRADIAITAAPEATIRALDAALKERTAERREAIAARYKRIAEHNQAARTERVAAARAGKRDPMSPDWASLAIAEVVGPDATVFSELGANAPLATAMHPDSFFLPTLGGGLGWCMPAALGAQMADRDRLVVATMGDGSYIFANPVACHQIAEALHLPILTVVFNNGIWRAVYGSTVGMYPDGHAARANQMPVTSLAPLPDFPKLAEASRGWGKRVERAEELPEVLAEAVDVVRTERRQALVEIAVALK